MHPVLVNLVLVNLNLYDNVKKYSVYRMCNSEQMCLLFTVICPISHRKLPPPPILPLTTSLLGSKYSSSGKQEAFCFPIIL